MQKLKLYYLNNDYINYLRTFDEKVRYNKGESRPYIGVVLKHNGFNYFAPLSSPRKKYEIMDDRKMDIVKIKNGKLGVVNINNMIPTPEFCLIELLPTIKDKMYKILLIDQLTFLNNNKRELEYKITNFYNLYCNDLLPLRIKERTCNFKLLEEKCLEYEKNCQIIVK